MLCVVMDSDETPLLIGSNDQAAYAMTPSPQLRMLLIGDLKTQPLQGVDLLNHREWYQAIKDLHPSLPFPCRFRS